MARFSRSDTNIDAVSQFTPQSFLGRGYPRTMRGRMRLSGLGFLDTFFPSDLSAASPYEITSPSTTSPGFDWGGLVSDVSQIFIAKEQADLQRDLMQMNIDRARQGLAPIPSSAIAPQVNVGVSTDAKRMITMVALGGAAILGGAYIFGGLKRKRRARRR